MNLRLFFIIIIYVSNTSEFIKEMTFIEIWERKKTK